MRFRVVHTVTYQYSRPVFLEPQTLRFCPRSGAEQRLLSHELLIEPAPVAVSHVNDLDAVTITHAWFRDLTPRFTIRAVSEVETLRANPFDYLILDARHSALPFSYDEPQRTALAPYLAEWERSPLLAQLVADARREAGGQTIAFLSSLAGGIHARIRSAHREEGAPHPPSQTLREGEGACRDLTLVFMHACRSVGIAARYVSGYQEGDGADAEGELHAWAEVYLPGGGWRGYDPTLGLAVADRHIAVAASYAPSETLPVSGAFRGEAKARMRAEIRIEPSGPAVESIHGM